MITFLWWNRADDDFLQMKSKMLNSFLLGAILASRFLDMLKMLSESPLLGHRV
jgi:hypothetical protein